VCVCACMYPRVCVPTRDGDSGVEGVRVEGGEVAGVETPASTDELCSQSGDVVHAKWCSTRKAVMYYTQCGDVVHAKW
jgi:hypothetical protein